MVLGNTMRRVDYKCFCWTFVNITLSAHRTISIKRTIVNVNIAIA